MPTLHLLGTGAALSDPHRTTTMLAFSDGESALVVDCGGDVAQRLLQAGVALDTIDALIVTHEHADHVSGFPLLMEKLWLSGRERPLPVYGLREGLEQARRAFEAFDTSGWEGLPEIAWREVPPEREASVMETGRWCVTASPVEHSKPTIGLRVESCQTGRAVAYSCDTAPSESVVTLAREADLLVHEATGEGPGHSSAEQAAEIAARADAYRLLLVHLPPGLTDDDLGAARQWFPHVELGEELGAYTF